MWRHVRSFQKKFRNNLFDAADRLVIQLSESHRYVLLMQDLLEPIQYKAQAVCFVEHVSRRAETLWKGQSNLELTDF